MPLPPASPLLQGKKIILGVTGSIAAYKAVLLLRLLQQHGATVRVVLTAAATRFVTPLTFTTIAQTPVLQNLWQEGQDWTAHVHWGEWAELLLIAPCTANTLHKLASGACNDALTAVALAARCPLLLAPAMDEAMWHHPATQANTTLLQSRGAQVIIPGEGFLASGLHGQGRMPEPEEIVQAVISYFAGQQAWQGKQVLISAGPTYEALDPVRYLSNHSTGKMGIALAESAARQGAAVTLVLGPSSEPIAPHPNLKLVRVITAAAMFAEMTSRQPAAHCIIMAAAVADYRPAQVAQQKIKKAPGKPSLTLVLEENPDILAYLGQHKPAQQLLVGFALETNDERAHALSKLQRKNLDFIVLNSLGDAGAGFGYDTNQALVLAADGTEHALPLMSKQQMAQELLALALHKLKQLKAIN